MGALRRDFRELCIKLASIALLLAPLCLAGPAARAEQVTEKRVDLTVPDLQAVGDARLQLRAALSAAEEGAGSLFQPRLETRSPYYGGIFAAASTASAVMTGAEGESSDIRFDGRGMAWLKQVYAGWSSGALLGALGEDAVSLSFGREMADDGTGLLEWDADPDRCAADCWMRRQPAQFDSATMTVKHGPGRLRLFHLQGKDKDNLRLGGLDARLMPGPLIVGASYFRPIDRATEGADLAADWGQGELGYDLAHLAPWSPIVTVRYRVARGQVAGDALPLALNLGAGEPLALAEEGASADLRLTLRPRAPLRLDLLYASRSSIGSAHEFVVQAEESPRPGVSLRMGGGLATPAADLEEDALEKRVSVALALSF
ncbi:MAG TPA: hypothetical protein VED46_06890 [Alphaproteobacteria bacterium]|nr:hypothetical protein [Alphaproteobacteria bacterium]